MKVLPWKNSRVPVEILIELFFENSSRKEFSTPQEKTKFLDIWFNIYLEEWPENIFIALNTQQELMGYLLGCSCSEKANDTLSPLNSSYSVFYENFFDFPAHLHVNVAREHQGQGVGKSLIEKFQYKLKDDNIQGLHAITSSEATNIKFYEKLGFLKIDEKTFKKWNLVFMGKKLFNN